MTLRNSYKPDTECREETSSLKLSIAYLLRRQVTCTECAVIYIYGSGKHFAELASTCDNHATIDGYLQSIGC